MRSTVFIALFGLTALISMTGSYVFSPRAASAVSVASIDAGGRHTCALVEIPEPAENYGVKCWGDNIYGQLGDGTNVDRSGPVNACNSEATAPCSSIVTVLWGVTAVSAGGIPDEREGGHTCALTRAGGVKCWGRNDSGQLGDGTNADRNRPVDVVGLTSGVAAVTAGGFHSCAVTTDGGVKCWGLNDQGQLGDGTNSNSNVPVDVCTDTECPALVSTATVPGEGSPPTLGAGAKHSCTLTDGGGLQCWGDNSSGQLGDGNTCGSACNTPTDVSGLTSGVITFALGGLHTCARVDGDDLMCWGWSGDGQLAAFNPPGVQSIPIRACAESNCTPLGDFLSSVSRVTAGDRHTCVKSTSDRVQCWGLNDQGQVGDGTNDLRTRPRDVCEDATCDDLLSGVEVVSGGGGHTCAVAFGGSLLCWGWNRNGQLGVGSNNDSLFPQEVPGAKTGISPTATPPATPTVAPPGLGDVNCSGDVSSVDALLVLQVNAGLLAALGCPDNADVNGDGRVDSLDAALILQFVAGFLDSLPP